MKEYIYKPCTLAEAWDAILKGKRVDYVSGGTPKTVNRKRLNVDSFIAASDYKVQTELSRLTLVGKYPHFQPRIGEVYNGLSAKCEIYSAENELLFIGIVDIHHGTFVTSTGEGALPEWYGEKVIYQLSEFSLIPKSERSLDV